MNPLNYREMGRVVNTVSGMTLMENLIDKINQIDTKHQTAVLVGHNPGITQLANYLASENLSPVQPCTAIKIELEIDNWNEIINGIGSILSINQP